MLSYSALTVLAGSTLLGLVGGVIGSFALLRRQSLLGDALAHAALPGVAIAFLATGSKSPLVLLAGAAVAGLAGALLVLTVVRGSRIKEDAAIGLVLSVFFGFGILLLTYIQKLPLGNQSGLDRFLFGQAATLVREDLVTMAVLGGVVLVAVALGFKELRLLCFDPAFGHSLGFPMRRLEVALTVLLVVVVVVGLQTVGVVLMVATLVTPAAAARQWTDRLSHMVLLSGGIGALSGAIGALLSASVPRLPTGPTIVLIASAVLLVSLLFAPRRGVLWARLAERATTSRIREENLLKDLYLATERAQPAGWVVAARGGGEDGGAAATRSGGGASGLVVPPAVPPMVAPAGGPGDRGDGVGKTERRAGAAEGAVAAGRSPAVVVSLAHLMGLRGQSGATLRRLLRPLVRRGLVRRGTDGVALTPAGLGVAAQVVRTHRLWELYLTRRLELASDHVHRDAEAMEHALSAAAVNDLEARLGYPRQDPHGRPIPPAGALPS
jgi:manganese/zinc/iron transport system permease protein